MLIKISLRIILFFGLLLIVLANLTEGFSQPSRVKADGFEFEMVYVPAGKFEIGVNEEKLAVFCESLILDDYPNIREDRKSYLVAECVKSLKTEQGFYMESSEVEIRAFWIDKYEVTVSQFEACWEMSCPE
jgi:formylglycine-generating enzyme required for sulfatase activity